jgi:AraC family transcriptional regulator
MSLSKLAVRLQRDEPGVIEVPGPADPHLVIHVGRSAEVECERDGSICRGLAVHGDIDIIPRGVPSRWTVKEVDTALIVRISQSLLDEAAKESGFECSAVTLRNRFRARDSHIERLAWALMAEMEEDFATGHLYLDGLAAAMASRLVRCHSFHAPEIVVRTTPRLPGHTLRSVLEYIEDNLSLNLEIADIAAVSGLSTSYCKKLFRETTGFPIHEYVIRRRVERAKALLMQGELSISHVALESGFSHQSHLARHMRRVLGYSPKMLKSRHRGRRSSPQP